MCGRYTLINDAELRERFDKPIEAGYAVGPRYNVAPGQYAPIITAINIEQMKWGLVPSWSKDAKIGYKMINARSETLMEKVSFKGLLKERRCLVPASGYYEWKVTEDGKQPYYFTVMNEPLISLAGLWTEWKDAEGYPMRSFTIITTEANPLAAEVHHRMPVILRREDEAKWLNNNMQGLVEVLSFLKPFPYDLMESHPVSKDVNKASADSPSLIKSL